MKLTKTIKKLTVKFIKLFCKTGKAYYKAKLKSVRLKHEIPEFGIADEILPKDLTTTAEDLKTLIKAVKAWHNLPEDSELLLTVEVDEPDEAKLEFEDGNGLSWEYEVIRSDYGKIV